MDRDTNQLKHFVSRSSGILITTYQRAPDSSFQHNNAVEDRIVITPIDNIDDNSMRFLR